MSVSKRKIEWDQVRRRLQEAERALEGALIPDSQRLEAVYRERAARLALRPASAEAAPARPVLVFRLGQARYAIELAELAEVLRRPALVPLPGGPPHLAGVMNLRGEIQCVWDLARLLNLPSNGDGSSGCVLLWRQDRRQAGLRVDRVEQVRSVPSREWQDPGDRASYLKAVTADMLLILDTEAFLKEVF